MDMFALVIDSGSGDESVLLKDASALATIELLVVMDLWLDYYFVLIEEVEMRLIMSTRGLVPVIGNNSLCNLSIVLRILFVEHHKEQIESGQK